MLALVLASNCEHSLIDAVTAYAVVVGVALEVKSYSKVTLQVQVTELCVSCQESCLPWVSVLSAGVLTWSC